MKRLKLYGEKKGLFGRKRKSFVATVHIENNEVVINTKNTELKKELLAGINKSVKEGSVILIKPIKIPPEPGKHKGGIAHGIHPQKPGDEKFLEALRSYHALWATRKFAGWEISGILSKIVEE